MATDSLLDRLIRAALGRGGERLDLVGGRPAVLEKEGRRLQAGNTVVLESELENWLEQHFTQALWVALQLGKEIEAHVELADGTHKVVAQRQAETFSVTIFLEVVVENDLGSDRQTGSVSQELESTSPMYAADSVDRPLDRLLKALVEVNGSDLHLSADNVPMFRLHGEMTPVPGVHLPLSSDHIMLMCDEISPAVNRREFRETSDTDLAYEIPGVARFRVNLFRDRHGASAVFRQIPSEILSFEDLALPESIRTLCTLSKGLVLVTGPTGSGKSTTLATMIDYINASRNEHIITIEDPIEFVHENKKCLVNQREVHSHTESFRAALRAALRQDPDIVLVGELRDLETMAIAIETAETGHLVFGTLHTTTAVSTIDRLIDQFPPDRQEQIRVMLSESLKGVVAQVLCRKIGGGRIAAFEILLGVPAVANLIREGKTFQIPSIMQTSKRLGMRTMNDALTALVKEKLIEPDEAISKAVDKDGLRGLLRGGGSQPGRTGAPAETGKK